MFRKILISILCIAMICSITACQSKSEAEHIPEEGEITIYYMAPNKNELVPYYEVVRDETVLEQVQHVLDSLANSPDGYISMLNKKNYPMSYSFQNGILTLVFTVDYSAMDGASELLLRASLVRSLCALDEVDGVLFYVGDQPLINMAGVEVGIMNADSFEDSIHQKLSEINIPLYFTDETGKVLVAEDRTISYPAGESPALYIVRELFDGPREEGHYPVENSGVSVKDVTVNEGICYLYFGSDFLVNTLEVDNEIPIYAIVNTLSEISEIGRVQFVVDKKKDAMFRNMIPLSKAFSSNLDLIREEK